MIIIISIVFCACADKGTIKVKNEQMKIHVQSKYKRIDINVPKSPWGFSKACIGEMHIQQVLDVVATIKILREYDVHPVPAGRGVQLYFYDMEDKIVLFIDCMTSNNIIINEERFYCEPNNLYEQLETLYESLDLPEKDCTPSKYKSNH